MTELLSDIGGTHARVARIGDGGGAVEIERFSIDDFPSVAAIFDRYCERKNQPKGGRVRIATAANPDKAGVWRFTNNLRHAIDASSLQAAGWTVTVLADDFVASAWGCLGLGDREKTVLRAGRADAALPRALLGPGTGLGLAYMIPVRGGWHVQQTFGGHMLAAAATQEQWDILDIVARLKTDATAIVPEDVASGRGLMTLYRAVCRHRGIEAVHASNAALLEHAGEPGVLETFRLFHEYLGLFAHHAIVTGHAYGGLYLDGGLVQALRKAGLFDFAAFARALDRDLAAVVRDAVDNTPIWIVDEPHVALRGLLLMPESGD